MAIRSTTTQLEAVQAAIQTAEAAQAAGQGDSNVQRANLATLYKREDQLLRRLKSEQGHRPRVATADMSHNFD
jgi:FixJ family two-component response regulator